MDIAAVIAELEAERERLDEAISALRGGKRGPGRSRNGRRHRMSAAARKKISEAAKKRWAKLKGKS